VAKGKLIVIEGSDGSGKSTQFALLAEYLKHEGKEAVTYHFPQYDEPSSYFVREYLKGNYGGAEELGAYAPSLFYALDRFQAAKKIRDYLDEGRTVLIDRFVGSNMAHQGQKIDDPSERKKYFKWVYDLEFNILRIPEPDLNIVLLTEAEVAQQLTAERKGLDYLDGATQDIHEADLRHLERAVATYRELCSFFPATFTGIECIDDHARLRPIDSIHQEIRGIVSHLI